MRRRTFLGGAAGLAGLSALTACGGATKTAQTLATCVSKLSFPEAHRSARSGMVVSDVTNVPVAWTKYPAPYASMPGPPGKGGTVTTFQRLQGQPPLPLAQNKWWQELNKRLGVTIQPTLVAGPDLATKLPALAASGNFPDITYINFGSAPSFQKVVYEGAFHDLTHYLSGKGLNEFPNLKLLPPETWKDSSFMGKIYGVPWASQPVNQMGMYRKDWAQKLGVDNPKNADDVMRMFVAFANGHPDGAGKQTWALPALYMNIFLQMFAVPYNWRLNKDGSLTKDLETEEFRATVDFCRQLWQKGAFHPNSLTSTLNQWFSLFESGRVGYFEEGGWDFLGNQAGEPYTLTRQANPSANPAPWITPGHNGKQPAMYMGPAYFGFAGIPASIKDESRIVELLHILEFYASPFGSQEFTFVYYGMPGLTYTAAEDGTPVVNDNYLALADGLYYMCGQQAINYFYSGQPHLATQVQQLEERLIQKTVTDPTSGLYSPTWIAQAGNLTQLQNEAYSSIVSGQQPLSYLNEAISSWKSQGGDAARKELQQALKQCR